MPAPAVIRASGGGTASPLWRQILADVLGAEIATVDTAEGAAYGAALLAAVGAGWFPTVEAAAAALVTATPVAAPGPDAPAYAEVHADVPGALPGARPDVPGARRVARRRPAGGRRPGAARAAGPRAPAVPQLWSSASSFSLTSLGLLAHDDHRQDLVLGHVRPCRPCRRACPGA